LVSRVEARLRRLIRGPGEQFQGFRAAGRSSARIVNLSRTGARIEDVPATVQDSGTLRVGGIAMEIPYEVVARDDDTVRVRLDVAPAAAAASFAGSFEMMERSFGRAA